MKKPFLKRMGDFLEGKGFYIVLFLCVARNRNFRLLSLFSLTPDEPDAPWRAPLRSPSPSPRPTPVDARAS